MTEKCTNRGVVRQRAETDTRSLICRFKKGPVEECPKPETCPRITGFNQGVEHRNRESCW